MSFWDIVWFIIISFLFVAYLMILFSIIMDLFRDSDTSGWVKAIWLVCLLFFPLITALIYVIVRGKGMSDQIAQASALLEKGTITQTEFDALKAKALAV